VPSAPPSFVLSYHSSPPPATPTLLTDFHNVISIDFLFLSRSLLALISKKDAQTKGSYGIYKKNL
jgi:hypothetical protein